MSSARVFRSDSDDAGSGIDSGRGRSGEELSPFAGARGPTGPPAPERSELALSGLGLSIHLPQPFGRAAKTPFFAAKLLQMRKSIYSYGDFSLHFVSKSAPKTTTLWTGFPPRAKEAQNEVLAAREPHSGHRFEPRAKLPWASSAMIAARRFDGCSRPEAS
jgi:hypothetical protein